MKIRVLLFLTIAFSFFSCEKAVLFSFQNPLEVERKDEVLVLTRGQIEAKSAVKEGFLPVVKLDDEIVASQADDINNDGKWDEIAFLLDFGAGETKNVHIEWVAENEYPVFEKRTNLRLGIIQADGSYKEVDEYQAPDCSEGFKIIAQAESVSWENDKMAFRNYFDCRNVKDLFGKLKPGLILDKIQTPEMGDYHQLADWGMDILHCGSSLGSGGIALLKNDSLFRLGSTKVYEYKKITEGPVRSVFELHYKGWEVDGDDLEAVERIAIYPGKYWFESEVMVTGCPAGCQIVTGIVTSMLKKEPFEFKEAGFQCIGTHDIQSLNNDELGMAVLVPLAEAGKIGRTSNINFFERGFQTVVEKSFSNIISETYYIGQNCESGKAAKHFFFAVWGLEKDQWKTESGFKKFIAEEAEKLTREIIYL